MKQHPLAQPVNPNTKVARPRDSVDTASNCDLYHIFSDSNLKRSQGSARHSQRGLQETNKGIVSKEHSLYNGQSTQAKKDLDRNITNILMENSPRHSIAASSISPPRPGHRGSLSYEEYNIRTEKSPPKKTNLKTQTSNIDDGCGVSSNHTRKSSEAKNLSCYNQNDLRAFKQLHSSRSSLIRKFNFGSSKPDPIPPQPMKKSVPRKKTFVGYEQQKYLPRHLASLLRPIKQSRAEIRSGTFQGKLSYPSPTFQNRHTTISGEGAPDQIINIQPAQHQQPIETFIEETTQEFQTSRSPNDAHRDRHEEQVAQKVKETIGGQYNIPQEVLEGPASEKDLVLYENQGSSYMHRTIQHESSKAKEFGKDISPYKDGYGGDDNDHQKQFTTESILEIIDKEREAEAPVNMPLILPDGVAPASKTRPQTQHRHTKAVFQGAMRNSEVRLSFPIAQAGRRTEVSRSMKQHHSSKNEDQTVKACSAVAMRGNQPHYEQKDTNVPSKGTTTDKTLTASPLGQGKKEAASRYENKIGPIIVFMGALQMDPEEEDELNKSLILAPEKVLASKRIRGPKGEYLSNSRRRQLAKLLAENKKYIFQLKKAKQASQSQEVKTKLSNYYIKFYKFSGHKNPISEKEHYYQKKCKDLKEQGEILAFSDDQTQKQKEQESKKRQASSEVRHKKLGWFSSSNLIDARDDDYEQGSSPEEREAPYPPAILNYKSHRSSVMNPVHPISLSKVELDQRHQPPRTNQGRYSQHNTIQNRSRPITQGNQRPRRTLEPKALEQDTDFVDQEQLSSTKMPMSSQGITSQGILKKKTPLHESSQPPFSISSNHHLYHTGYAGLGGTVSTMLEPNPLPPQAEFGERVSMMDGVRSDDNLSPSKNSVSWKMHHLPNKPKSQQTRYHVIRQGRAVLKHALQKEEEKAPSSRRSSRKRPCQQQEDPPLHPHLQASKFVPIKKYLLQKSLSRPSGPSGLPSIQAKSGGRGHRFRNSFATSHLFDPTESTRDKRQSHDSSKDNDHTATSETLRVKQSCRNNESIVKETRRQATAKSPPKRRSLEEKDFIQDNFENSPNVSQLKKPESLERKDLKSLWPTGSKGWKALQNKRLPYEDLLKSLNIRSTKERLADEHPGPAQFNMQSVINTQKFQKSRLFSKSNLFSSRTSRHAKFKSSKDQTGFFKQTLEAPNSIFTIDGQETKAITSNRQSRDQHGGESAVLQASSDFKTISQFQAAQPQKSGKRLISP